MSKIRIGWKIGLFYVFVPGWAWAGQCEIKEPLRDGLFPPTISDKEILKDAKSLQKCTEASMRSGFLNRYILSYRTEDTNYLLISGQIIAVNGTVLQQFKATN